MSPSRRLGLSVNAKLALECRTLPKIRHARHRDLYIHRCPMSKKSQWFDYSQMDLHRLGCSEFTRGDTFLLNLAVRISLAVEFRDVSLALGNSSLPSQRSSGKPWLWKARTST